MATRRHVFQARVRKLLPTGIGVVLVLVLGAFAYSASVIEHFPGEVSASLWVQSSRAPWLDTVMKVISLIAAAMLPLSVVTAAVLYLRRWRKESLLIAANTVVGFVLVGVIKEAVARPRPPADLVQVIQGGVGYSFPSGSAMGSAVFLGTLMVILTMRMNPGMARTLMQGVVVVVVVASGLSRVYLGAHWLGDVVGGYAFGAGVVVGAVWLWRRWTNRKAEADGS